MTEQEERQSLADSRARFDKWFNELATAVSEPLKVDKDGRILSGTFWLASQANGKPRRKTATQADKLRQWATKIAGTTFNYSA